MNPTTRARLMNVSTATLCTVLVKGGMHNQFIQDVRPLNSGPPNMVGEAFTLRYMPAREDAPVFSADVVVGESEGVIPGKIAAEATEMTVFEDFVQEKGMEGRPILGLYPPTDENRRTDFAAWR